jgi:hypothetical protein
MGRAVQKGKGRGTTGGPQKKCGNIAAMSRGFCLSTKRRVQGCKRAFFEIVVVHNADFNLKS